MKSLTTTSYALLGLLALQSWTTYELAQQMERSLRNFWPRAQSKLYEEPKNLVAHGLASVKREHVGKRPRSVYSITPAGRAALRRWLDEPGDHLAIEFEALLKVFFADQGSKGQLLAQVRSMKEWAARESERGDAFIREYSETGGPFPERLQVIGLTVGFLHSVGTAMMEWAEWAEAEVNSWKSVREEIAPVSFQRMLERKGSHVEGE